MIILVELFMTKLTLMFLKFRVGLTRNILFRAQFWAHNLGQREIFHVVLKTSAVRMGDAHEHELEIMKSLQVHVRARP